MPQLSGQVTVTTAGIAVQLASAPTGYTFALKAHPDNTGTLWVGGNAAGTDVDNTNGFPLDPGEGLAVDVLVLGELWIDADVSGEKLCWFLVSERRV